MRFFGRTIFRKFLTAFGFLLLIFFGLGFAMGCCSFSASGFSGSASDHFDGERFHNLETGERNFGDVLKWWFERKRSDWVEVTNAELGAPPPKRVKEGEIRATFVNHSTVLIQMDGLNILADPIWSERAGPFAWAGPKRVRPPGIRFEELPPIDAVVISHNHYDHLDIPTLKRLSDAHKPKIFIGLGNGEYIKERGIENGSELDWWQSARLSGAVTVTMVPARHFSQRGFCDRNKTLWGGYVIEGNGGAVYFAGDTGFGSHFEKIRERFGGIRLAFLPIGAFRPEWFMGVVHLSPPQAVEAHKVLGAETSVAIHFGTFRLADDGQNEPVEELEKALKEKGVSKGNFWVLNFGEGRTLPNRRPATDESPALHPKEHLID